MAIAAQDQDYIDIEVCPSTPLTNPPTHTIEFEFTCNGKGATTSPADELFYKGKLLPLHPPQRHRHPFDITKVQFQEEDDYYTMALPKCPTALDSTNISPSESCRVSCELNPHDYCYEWSNELTGFIGDHMTKRSNWSKRLKLIKHTVLGHKLRSSKAYLKSLFSKSACSDGSSMTAHSNAGVENLPGAYQPSDKHSQVARKMPFHIIGRAPHPTIAMVIKDSDPERIQDSVHRKSFSSAIMRHSQNKCLSTSSSNSSSVASSLSSSFSLNSNGFHELHFLRRSSSATEIENSIEAAIAHCKKSQQDFDSRNSSRELGICVFPASGTPDL